MKTTPRSHSPLFLLPSLLAAGLTATQGQDFNYRSGLTPPTEVTTAANWAGGVVPGPADFASWITDLDPVTAGNQESTAGSLTFATPVSWKGIRFRDALGAGTLSGADLTLGDGGIEIGYENFRINNVLSGSAPFTVTRWAGSGALQLGAANLLTGGVLLGTNATLEVYNTTALGTGDITVTGNNATFRLGTGSNNLANNIIIGEGFNLNVGAGFFNHTGVISGPGRLTSTNSIQLRGSNTWTGGATMTSGFLCIDRDENLGAIPLDPAVPNLTFSAGGYLSNYIATANVVLDANRSITLTAGNTGGFDIVGRSLTVPGVISGTGSFRKQGNNNLILTGANTYTGGTRLAVGTLTVSNTAALGTGDVTVTNVANAGIPAINAQSSFSNNIIITTGAGLGFGGGFANINGVISGPGRIQSSNSGVMRGDNTYEGGTNITGGFLCITKDASLGLLPAVPVANNINISSGGSLSNYPAPGGSTVTVHANRGITLAAGTTGGIDTINGTTFVLNGVISGEGGLRLTSGATTGTLILNGLNTYTGATFLGRNTTWVTTLKNVGDSSGSSLGNPATVAAGTIHLGSGTVTGTSLRYVGTGNTTDRVINLAATTGNAAISQSGTGLLKFTSDFTATAPGSKTLILRGSTAGTGEVAGAIVDNENTSSLALTFSAGTDQVSLNAVDGIAAGATITGTGIDAGTTILAVDPGSLTVTLSKPTIAASSAIGSTYNVSGAFHPTAVTKDGTGTWSLTGANRYTGPTTVNNGTLRGSGASMSNLTINAGGTLAPGPGIFAAASTALLQGSILQIELNSTTLTSASLVSLGGVDLGNAVLRLQDSGNAILPLGTKFTLINYVGSTLTSSFFGLDDGATVAAGRNAFTLRYDDGSKVTLTAVASTGYSTWASANASGQGAALDTDGDGTPNGIEYFMGETAPGFTPTAELVNGTISWPKDPAAVASYAVEASSDLTNWTPVSNVQDNGTIITAALGATDPKRFVRLKVVVP